MTQIGSKTRNSQKLYVITLPVAVAELHLPPEADPKNPTHNQWWSPGNPENVQTRIMEIRVWATSPEQAVDNIASSLHKLSNGR